MISNLTEYFTGKSVLVLGYGKEGASSLKTLLSLNFTSKIGVADKSTELSLPDVVTPHLGEDYLSSLSQYDIVLKSPGIPLATEYWNEYSDKLTSQTELFLRFFKGTSVGVTGTKGKSTTTSLLYSILKEAKTPSHLVGNIGTPIFEKINEIAPSDIVIFEASSHQLHRIKASPKIAVLLNIFPEHLDYYESFDKYRDAKLNIFKYQDGNDRAFLGSSVKEQSASSLKADNVTYIDESAELPFSRELYAHLPGKHLAFNISVANHLAKQLNISKDDIENGIKNFTLAPHRLEILPELNSVTYVNDSASTIPEATIHAIEAFPTISTLIVGGYNRGVQLRSLIEYLENNDEIQCICIPETGTTIKEALSARKHTYEAPSLEEGVEIAKEITPPNTVCLFSPAAASYHRFKNYQERGELFKSLILNPT